MASSSTRTPTSCGWFVVVEVTSELAEVNAPSAKVDAEDEDFAPTNTHRLLLAGMSDGCVPWLYGCTDSDGATNV